jgi:phage shock protein E
MMESLKRILGMGPTVKYDELVKQGAVILDVRSKAEYQTGHIRGSVNIPVDQLKNNLHRLPDKQKPVITCCASGMRSAAAREILISNGYKNVCNGGGWVALENKI